MPIFLETVPPIAEILLFSNFQMAAAAILDFQNNEISLADQRLEGSDSLCAKRRQNWSFRCRDIAIFRIFKVAAAAIFDF